jgi:hypothetical protein
MYPLNTKSINLSLELFKILGYILCILTKTNHIMKQVLTLNMFFSVSKPFPQSFPHFDVSFKDDFPTGKPPHHILQTIEQRSFLCLKVSGLQFRNFLWKFDTNVWNGNLSVVNHNIGYVGNLIKLKQTKVTSVTSLLNNHKIVWSL